MTGFEKVRLIRRLIYAVAINYTRTVGGLSAYLFHACNLAEAIRLLFFNRGMLFCCARDLFLNRNALNGAG